MAKGKVVALGKSLEPDRLDALLGEMPDGWSITALTHDDGKEKIAGELRDARYLVSLGGRITEELLEGAEELKLIQAWGMGTDNLPVKWCIARGITVANAGGANSIAVAEHTLLLILSCLRRLIPFSQSILAGEFMGTNEMPGSFELFDKTVGVIGFGNIGRRVAKLCHGFGANIVFFERYFVPYAVGADLKAKAVDLDELLATSDIVTLHVPSFKANKQLIGPAQFDLMKPSSFIINTSRGDIIDEAALISALRDGKIAGAGLDVFDPEPPDSANPLLKMKNVVATPHIGGLSDENKKLRCETIWRNVLLVSEGKAPLNIVNEF